MADPAPIAICLILFIFSPLINLMIIDNCC